MTVKDHYDNHLAKIYSWITGDFEAATESFRTFLVGKGIAPSASKVALDLGAGNGIQSHALASLGFEVTAVDFNQIMLNELQENCKEFEVRTALADITKVGKWVKISPEVIVCCGDTITHLESVDEATKFLVEYSKMLAENGHMILTFRDYMTDQNETLFIPVKSDQDRILTCVLEYQTEKVKVTDLLYERDQQSWNQKFSSYNKIRLSPDVVKSTLQKEGLKIIHEETKAGMLTLMAKKG